MTVFLLNNAGNPVHSWTTPLPTRTGDLMFLRANGELVFGADNGFFALDPDGSVAWNIVLAEQLPPGVQRHHDVVEMPNGHMLIPAFIRKTAAEAAAAGFDVAGANQCKNAQGRDLPDVTYLYVDSLWELAPTNAACGFACGWQVVWNWNLWDHYSSEAQVPNKAHIAYDDPAQGVCGQFVQNMWLFGRFNAVDYHAARDEILISESLFNEIWVIAHGTTTEEARGPAGDLIYRWGNPYAYGAGEPFVDRYNRGDQQLSFQHRVHWIAPGVPGEGNVLIFNNGQDWGDSAVMEVRLPNDSGGYLQPAVGEPFEPAALVWQYDEYGTPGSFFASFVSSAERLANGNTLINKGPVGYFFEVTPGKEKVWEYVYPLAGYADPPAPQGSTASLSAYRAYRYAPDFPGLIPLGLVAGDPLEQYPHTYTMDVKPGSCSNPVNRGSNGMLPVAILGSAELDVSTIDLASLRLEGFMPARASIEDAGAPSACDATDGYPDVVLKFDAQLVRAALSGLPAGPTTLRLTGHSSAGWFLAREVVTVK